MGQNKNHFYAANKKTHVRLIDTQTESEEMKRIFHAIRNRKQASGGRAILPPDKTDFSAFEGSQSKKVNICAPNLGTPKYKKRLSVDIKAEVNSNTVTVGDFNTPLTSMDRSPRQKINKKQWL